MKLVRTCDVSSILGNRNKLAGKPGMSIKPDQTREEREIQAVLLKKRWELVTSGTSRGNIKIKRNALYVNNRKHGSVVNKVYRMLERSPSPPLDSDSH